jgi:predicted dehydrogenase
MSEQLLRVGIVGTGFGVHGHLPAWKQVDGAQVTAICSRFQARASALAEKHGIPHAFSDPTALAEHPDVDLVIAAGTPGEHVEQVVAAAKAGKAVLCEKPLGIDAEVAAPMLRAVEGAGVPNFMNFEFRCRAAPQPARPAWAGPSGRWPAACTPGKAGSAGRRCCPRR